MSASFVKLFNSILHSTIWSEPNHVRIVWITMLAMSNRYGDVDASIPGLARMAGQSVEEVEDAITRFLSPDPYSRTPDNDGRRIKTIVGGWHLLNHGKYRELLSAEERKEYNRKKQAERRAKLSVSVNDKSITVNDSQQCQHIQIPDTDTDTEEPKSNMSATADDGEKYSSFIERLWAIFPAKSRLRSSKAKLLTEWKKVKPKPPEEEVITMASKWAMIDEWKKQGGQYAPGAHIWIKDKKWESEPEQSGSTLEKETLFDDSYEKIG